MQVAYMLSDYLIVAQRDGDGDGDGDGHGDGQAEHMPLLSGRKLRRMRLMGRKWDSAQ